MLSKHSSLVILSDFINQNVTNMILVTIGASSKRKLSDTHLIRISIWMDLEE